MSGHAVLFEAAMGKRRRPNLAGETQPVLAAVSAPVAGRALSQNTRDIDTVTTTYHVGTYAGGFASFQRKRRAAHATYLTYVACKRSRKRCE
jgi:Ser/Thr protein kinase RdoA (MazF antagonist)